MRKCSCGKQAIITYDISGYHCGCECHKRRCFNCESLGVKDSTNVYICCIECRDWKLVLQEKPG